jgi:hypothetical protein
VKVDLPRAVIPMLFVLAVTVAIGFLRGPTIPEGPSEAEKARLVSRVELYKSPVAPGKEDAETWPN